ncbi:MAG: hypothetical protein E6G00_11050 [Actinobacteria bacterium]|nr:MAG: hypothetical protein E6G00_11050 [Actinomycetota bacterium]
MVCAGLAGIALATAPAAADAAGFLAGASKQDMTPPKAGTPAGNAADSEFAPTFSTACVAFPNPGTFALQEPFVDTNGNGRWDDNPPEPYCDANGNGRWDGIYTDNGFGPLKAVHDPIDVRAVAISDGRHKPLVYTSVKLIGIFDYYTEEARAVLKNKYGVDANLVVSANHNESSPDSIGLYGALQTGQGAGVRSGIDEYYMSFVEDKIAHAAADAVHNLKPATLFANQVGSRIPDGTSGNRYPLLTGLSQRISDQFPTAVARANDDRVASVDPKMGVLQARASNGQPIFTVMSLSAHNQEMGMTPPGDLSADWPGAFERKFDATHPGMAMFLVGDNGSIEDPQTDPPAKAPDGTDIGSEYRKDQTTLYIQTQATGERFASLAADAASKASQLTPGPVTLTRKAICLPLENNAFVLLAAAGVFGKRQAYVCNTSGDPIQPVPNGDIATSGAQFRSFVGYANIGPDLQLIDNPGESFPALMLGTPFGKEEESCDRPNPAVPTWHARALYRFQVGLADDLVGYLIPAWGFAEIPGVFNTDACGLNPQTRRDMNGHKHKLETESIGPTGANDIANTLASMLNSEKDPTAHIVQGRFVLPDGSYSHWPTGAAGILVPAAGASALDPAGGTLIGDPHTAGFGRRGVDATGFFMDYDGQPQSRPDVTTRGMMVFDPRGCVAARYYLDVFPTLDGSKKLGAAASQAKVKPVGSCAHSVQPGAKGGPKPGCPDRRPPRSAINHRRSGLHRNRLVLYGRAYDRGCNGKKGRVVRVVVTVARHLAPGRCRFLLPDGRHLGRTRACDGRPPLLLLARGTGRWSLKMRLHLAPGAYVIRSLAVDRAGNRQPVRHHGRNVLNLRVHGRR